MSNDTLQSVAAAKSNVEYTRRQLARDEAILAAALAREALDDPTQHNKFLGEDSRFYFQASPSVWRRNVLMTACDPDHEIKFALSAATATAFANRILYLAKGSAK